MPHTFDATFKFLLRGSSGYGTTVLFGGPVIEWLDVEQPIVTKRVGDLLGRTSDGVLHHIELQVRNDMDMPFRMLEYYVGYYRRHGHVEQVVLYVGAEPLRMKDVFESKSNRHTFRIVQIRDLDPADFLATGDVGDTALALLTGKDRERVIAAALAHLAKLEGDERAGAQATFVIISAIIGIEEEIVRRLDINMIDLMENKVIGPLLRQSELKGKIEGKIEGKKSAIHAQLQQRFGPLPASAVEKIDAADDATVDVWIGRVITASSLKAVFEGEHR